MTTTTPAADLPAAGPPVHEARGFWAAYGRAWARTPGSAVYLLVVFVLAMLSLSVLAALFWTSVGLLVIVVGLPLGVLTLLIARGFGVADRFLLLLAGLPSIVEPEWNRDSPAGDGFWATLTRPIRNPHYWVYLVHGMIVSPVVSTISFALTTVWLSVGLGGLTYWFWGAFLPRGDRGDGDGGEWGHYVADAVPWLFGGWSGWAVEVVLYLIAGILFTATMPWVLGGLARAHHAIGRGMLGRWESDDLAAEVRAEAAARGAAVHAEDVALRRLERDIHDGPQQRLVPPPDGPRRPRATGGVRRRGCRSRPRARGPGARQGRPRRVARALQRRRASAAAGSRSRRGARCARGRLASAGADRDRPGD